MDSDRFPNNVTDGPANPANRRYSALTGGYSLRNEHITVTYQSTAADVDPREIKSTVTWQNKFGRTFSAAMATFKTGK
jgi:hypothetical protein